MVQNLENGRVNCAMQESKVRVQVKLQKQQLVQIVTLVLTIIMLAKCANHVMLVNFKTDTGQQAVNRVQQDRLGLVRALVLALFVQLVDLNLLQVQVHHVAYVALVPELLKGSDVKSALMGKQRFYKTIIKFSQLEFVKIVKQVISQIHHEPPLTEKLKETT